MTPMATPAAHFCLAMILSWILSYVAFGTMPFCTSSSLRLYGRPLMILSE